MLEVELSGIADVEDMLDQIAPRQANNIMRATVHAIAGEIRNDAKRNMPHNTPQSTGAMIRGTKAKREKSVRGRLLSTVRVAGAFYWRFLEYGQGPDNVEHAMFGKAVAKFRADQERIFVEQFGKKFEAALARAHRRQASGR